MKKLSIIFAALLTAALLTSATATAKPKDVIGSKQAAKQSCEALRRADQEAFNATYGTWAIRACVQGEKPETRDEIQSATQGCRDQRGHTEKSRKAFRRTHRTIEGGSNALGRCVSSGLRAQRGEARAAFKHAARECRVERGDTDESRAAFEEKYGTNEDLLLYRPTGNAFGKCVSSKVEQGKKE